MTASTFTDLVRVATATTGTGTLTLGAALTGFLNVPASLDGKTVTYEIAEPASAPTAREVGRGVYTLGGTTLTRAQVLASTNSNAAINLTSGAAAVSLTVCADDLTNPSPVTQVMQGELTLAASTTAACALDFTAGSLMTATEEGSMEYEGKALYFSPAATARGVVPSVQFVALSSTFTLTSTTNVQKLFNVPSNGSLTVAGSTSYFFDALISINTMNATNGNAKFDFIGAGSATMTSSLWSAVGLDATTPGTAAAAGGSITATNVSSGNIVTAATGTAMFAVISGIFRVNAGGTIIPSIGLTTANAAVVQPNSYFRCWPIGTNTVTSCGQWT